MPQQILCSNSVENKNTLAVNQGKEPILVACGSPYFRAVTGLFLFSAFESTTGKEDLQMMQAFKCDECGAIIDIQTAKKQQIKPQFHINGGTK